MPLKLAIDNGKKHINNMTPAELQAAQDIAVALPFDERQAFFEQLLKPAIPAFQDDILSPDWLTNEFPDPVWYGQFGALEKTIDFCVRLDDGSALTDPANNRFLHTLKYWLACQTHPRYCGGNRLKPETAYTKIRYALQIIDYFLLQAKRFRLADFGLSLITDNDLAVLMQQIRVGANEGIYDWTNRISQDLKQHATTVSPTDIEAFLNAYPDNNLPPEDMTLDLALNELVKAKAWLVSEGAYAHRSRNHGSHGSVYTRFFQERFYQNTLHGGQAIFPIKAELTIQQSSRDREFLAVPVRSEELEGITEITIQRYRTALRSLRLVTGAEFQGVSSTVLDAFDQQSPLPVTGSIKRYRSLPAVVVNNAMRDAYEFAEKYADDILKAVGQVLQTRLDHKGKKDGVINKMNALTPKVISNNLKTLRVQRWAIAGGRFQRPDDYFYQLRANVGLNELYTVLMGSIQIYIGVLMARRVGELIDLQHDCLIPKDKDPHLKKHQHVNYSLVFDNRKSGEDEDRETLVRPIVRSGAKFIWKLQQFRHRLIDHGCLSKQSGLMLSISDNDLRAGTITGKSYVKHLDTLCDYFETPVITLGPGDVRRYYIRQHQLRRYFAMCFFWGSGYDGLDTLRWFLGHTDAEHLWHYITENTPGAVLRSAKTETIVNGLNADNIEGIERLRELLEERFKINRLTIESIADVVDDYQADAEQGYVELDPTLSSLRQELEADVETLLAEGVIDLEPTFCTVQRKNGKVEQKVTLVLVVKEIDDAI